MGGRARYQWRSRRGFDGDIVDGGVGEVQGIGDVEAAGHEAASEVSINGACMKQK